MTQNINIDNKLSYVPSRGWLIVRPSVLDALNRLQDNKAVTTRLSSKSSLACPMCGINLNSMCSSLSAGGTTYVFHDRLLYHCITEHNMSLPTSFVKELLGACGVNAPKRIVAADTNGVHIQQFFEPIKAIENKLLLLLLKRSMWEKLTFNVCHKLRLVDGYEVATIKRIKSKWWVTDHQCKHVPFVHEEWFVEPVNIIDRSDVIMTHLTKPAFWR